MENISLLESFSEFKDEKLIDRVTLMVILEEVFRNTLTKKFGTDENFDIIINPDKGDLEIWRNRIVVKDGEVEDPNAEIELKEAVKIEPDFKLSLIELNAFSKLLIGVAIITKSEFFTASPALLNISSESLSFSMISFTDLLLS